MLTLFSLCVSATAINLIRNFKASETRILSVPSRDASTMETPMKTKKIGIDTQDLDRGLSVKKEDLKQLKVKTGLRAGLASAVACCSGCHCQMA
jgi:hypothetical protein